MKILPLIALMLCAIMATGMATPQAEAPSGSQAAATPVAPAASPATDSMGMPLAQPQPSAPTTTDRMGMTVTQPSQISPDAQKPNTPVLTQWPTAMGSSGRACCGMGGGMMGMMGMSGMSGMGGMMGMMGMGGMSNMGSMTSTTGMNSMSGMTGQNGLSMAMDQGATIRYMVQLVTLQDVLEALQNLVEIQQKSGGTGDQQSAALSALAKKVGDLLEENRSQIIGLSNGQ